jgi:hypothetical protein
MPFFDRFWWLRATGALLLAVGVAGTRYPRFQSRNA